MIIITAVVCIINYNSAVLLLLTDKGEHTWLYNDDEVMLNVLRCQLTY